MKGIVGVKKLFFISLCIILSFSLTGCTKSTNINELRIASEILSGDFMDGFSSSDYDNSIMEMIHGYSTYEYDETGAMVLNEVPVTEAKRSEDEEGNIAYDFTIADDLKWSDGTALTAQDYVFAILFDSSKEWIDAGAMNANYDHVIGYEAYSSGETTSFSGVSLIDDTHFRMILDKEMLPYFNEEILVMVAPKPMHLFTSGKGNIMSDETGSHLDGIEMSEVTKYAKDEYRHHPSVSCGPYVFDRYEDHLVKLTKNPYFKGDFRHQIPEIETIIVKEMDSSLHVNALLNGDVDLISDIISDNDIKKIKEHDEFIIEDFESKAYGNLAFACDFGPTRDVHVRRAINYALDKNELIMTSLGGLAIGVYSDYVPAQWMAIEKAENLKTLNAYSFNLDKAMEELNQSTYIYEADGVTLFDKNKIQEDGSYLRYNAEKEPLMIRHLGSEGNVITDSIQLQLSKNARKLGMKFTVDYGDFASISQHYYDGTTLAEHRMYHSFNLANVLQPGYDPFYNYHSMFAGTAMNPSGIQDTELDGLLETMEMSDLHDRKAFLDAWFAYEKRFNEILLVIPLYISTEHVIHTNNIEGVNVNTMEGYSHIISGIRFK